MMIPSECYEYMTFIKSDKYTFVIKANTPKEIREKIRFFDAWNYRLYGNHVCEEFENDTEAQEIIKQGQKLQEERRRKRRESREAKNKGVETNEGEPPKEHDR